MKPFQAQGYFVGLIISSFLWEVGRYIVKGEFNFYEMLGGGVGAAVGLGILFGAYKYIKTP